MKKYYEAPALDELSVKAEEILLASSELAQVTDPTGNDLDWTWGLL